MSNQTPKINTALRLPPLLKKLLHGMTGRPAFPTLESFFDVDLNAIAIAPIPPNLKREVGAQIDIRSPVFSPLQYRTIGIINLRPVVS